MGQEIAFENGRISDFQGLVTLTLDRVILNTLMHHLSTSTYIPNFMEIEETLCGRTDGRTDDHITDAIISLHWLRVPERIQYNLATGTLAYRVLHGDSPRTLPWSADPRRRLARTTTTPLCQHQPPRGTASEAVNSRQPAELLRLQTSGTDCQLTSSLQIHCQLFVDC